MSLERLKQVSEELSEAQRKVQEFAKAEGSQAVFAAFQPFFEKFPRVGAIRWTQYSPHFNDGDPCTFSVHDPEFELAEDSDQDAAGAESDDVDVEEDEDEGEFDWRMEDAKYGKGANEAFDELWAEMHDDVLEAIFGDGYQITVTRTEITVDEYDHD